MLSKLSAKSFNIDIERDLIRVINLDSKYVYILYMHGYNTCTIVCLHIDLIIIFCEKV